MENINLNDNRKNNKNINHNNTSRSNTNHNNMDSVNINHVNMIYSCLLHKDKKRIVRVTFERTGTTGYEYAEGIIPDGIIERQKGFTQEEVTKLESYLKEHVDDIFSKAKEISGLKHWMR